MFARPSASASACRAGRDGWGRASYSERPGGLGRGDGNGQRSYYEQEAARGAPGIATNGTRSYLLISAFRSQREQDARSSACTLFSGWSFREGRRTCPGAVAEELAHLAREKAMSFVRTACEKMY